MGCMCSRIKCLKCEEVYCYGTLHDRVYEPEPYSKYESPSADGAQPRDEWERGEK